MIQKNGYSRLLPFLLCPVALIWSVQHDPFFWDTVQLASKHAHHFYENHLQWLPLPAVIDSGHPPCFGYYLACIWTVFGKNLPASHWAMLPFLLLNVCLLYRLGRRLGGDRLAFWLIPLVFLDPVMAGQNVMISPDVVLVSGFLLAVEGILGRSKFFISIGVLILCMISMRGMMTAGALFVWQMAGVRNPGLYVRRNLLAAAQSALVFIPGFAFAAWFLWWHRNTAGWVGHHPDSPWAPAFEQAGGMDFVKNCAVLGWRWLDFGRVFEWIGAGILMWKYPLRKKGVRTDFRVLILLVLLILFLSPTALLFKNISAHRYFLPAFIAFHLFVFQWFATAQPSFRAGFETKKPPLFSYAPVVLIVLIALGNLWVYPTGTSMGWDATLAHLPYHRLRVQAVDFLEKNNIDFSTVGSDFPNLNTGENLLLNGDTRQFAEKDFSRNRYFLASNIFNDISETDDETLRQNWTLIKKWQHAGVDVTLYARRQ